MGNERGFGFDPTAETVIRSISRDARRNWRGNKRSRGNHVAQQERVLSPVVQTEMAIHELKLKLASGEMFPPTYRDQMTVLQSRLKQLQHERR